MNIENAPPQGSAGLPVPLPEVYRFRFHGDGMSFFMLLLKNLLLTLLTFGIYTPWAKTERRRYIWSNLEIHGQRLQYTGTGRELFNGYVKVIGVYLGVILVSFALGSVSPILQEIAQVGFSILFLFLIPFAMYWSRAYLLSRTRWRGIRFGLAGSAKPFAMEFLGGYFLSVFSLGLYLPVFIHRLRRIMTNQSRLGSEFFSYDGKGKEFWWLCMKGILLTLLTLGVYYPWFLVQLQRYRIAHISLGKARGSFSLRGIQMLKLLLLNIFGTTLTLGIAFPWITTYSLRVLCDHVAFHGVLDFNRILQAQSEGSGAADGLADALGVDLGL